MPNLSIGPFGPRVTIDELAAFFADNGVTVTDIVIEGQGCAKLATATAVDPASVVTACNGHILLIRPVRVVQL